MLNRMVENNDDAIDFHTVPHAHYALKTQIRGRP
jgi:hypothetical protein